MNAALTLSGLLAVWQPVPADSVQKQVGLQAHTGFIIPHAPDLRSIAQTQPVGVELTYSRTSLHRAAYERCNCFARVGAYVNYVGFNNPLELGRAVGAGGYFEPLIRYRKPLYFSLRVTAGLAYLTRVYEARTNPRNTFFSSPLSGMLALSASVHHRLSDPLQLSATAGYNHISNGGIRQPNRGMNFPTLALGWAYRFNPTPFPNPERWSAPAPGRRFVGRVMSFGSVRVLPQTTAAPERAGWVWGLTVTAGYRASRFHAFTGGLDYVDDGYLRGQLRRDGRMDSHRQLGLLSGYELRLGRYVFATHAGWNVVQPASLLNGRLFQRYQLLYTLRKRYWLGVGLRARLNVAEGFDGRIGVEL